MLYEITDSDGRLIARRMNQIDAMTLACMASYHHAKAVLVLCWHVGAGSHVVASLLQGELLPVNATN